MKCNSSIARIISDSYHPFLSFYGWTWPQLLAPTMLLLSLLSVTSVAGVSTSQQLLSEMCDIKNLLVLVRTHGKKNAFFFFFFCIASSFMPQETCLFFQHLFLSFFFTFVYKPNQNPRLTTIQCCIQTVTYTAET